MKNIVLILLLTACSTFAADRQQYLIIDRLTGQVLSTALIWSNTTNLAANRSSLGLGSLTLIGNWTGSGNFTVTGTNSLMGDVIVDKTITAPGTTTTQTINKNAGRVNIAAASDTATVIDSRVTANSVIVANPAANDTTLNSVSVQAFSGSFTITGDAAASAETPVNFLIIN